MFIPRVPLHVVLILGTRCNLRCLHCSSAAGQPGPDELEDHEIFAIVEELAEAGIVDIALSGGEPLLRKDLEQIIERARALGMRVGTSTNGIPLTAKRARSLIDAGLNRLQVSVDGTRSTHDHIRGPGSWDGAAKAVERAVRAGLRTHVCFTAMASNHRELPEVVEDALARGAHGFNLSQFVVTGRGDRREALSPRENLWVMQEWRRLRAIHPGKQFTAHLSGLAAVSPEVAEIRGFVGCQAGIHIACITATGDVTPCVMLPLVVGNIRRARFIDIWRGSPVIQRLQYRQLQGACGRCRHVRSCGGCRAAAWSHTKNLMADDPSCWLLCHSRESQPLSRQT